MINMFLKHCEEAETHPGFVVMMALMMLTAIYCIW